MATIKKEYSVLGMTCGMCQVHVQKALNKEVGIVTANVDLASQTAQIEYNPEKTDPKKIKMAVDAAGYQLVLED